MPSYPFSGDSQGSEVIALLKTEFLGEKCFVRAERFLLFVCGGRTDQVNGRTRFLAFAETTMPSVKVLVAEAAYGDYIADSRKRVINLAWFEKILAELADCILIFPESDSSIAELGFFSAYRPVLEKTLAVNELAFQASDSFIALGPLAAINEYSEYSPTLLTQVLHSDTHLDIEKRLKRLVQPKRRQRLSFSSWPNYSLKEKFFVVFETLRLFRVVHAATLPYLFGELFGGAVAKDEIKHLVAVLVASKLVRRAGDDERYLVATSPRSFIDIPAESELLLASNNYLLKQHGDLYSEVFK